MVDKNKKMVINFELPLFDHLVAPNGMLAADMACHALWFYYGNAIDAYQNHIIDPVVYEGDLNTWPKFFALFKSISHLYDVQPERMLKFWANVNLQAQQMGYPLLPEEYQFRKIAELKLQ